MPLISIIPRVEGLGGVTSFRLKFEDALQARGIKVINNFADSADVILVLAGTKHLLPLWRAHRRGQRIVQRLDGINWIHRVRWAGPRYTIRAIYGNWNLSLIRKRLADHVIYQSEFIKNWWEDWYRSARVPNTVILNGVDLEKYTSNGLHERPTGHYRILIVEGSLTGALNSGLFYGAELAERLAQHYKIELCIVGKVDRRTKRKLERYTTFRVRLLDAIPREQIPWIMRSSHLLFSAEVNPPCPNSVIEALACGLPVIGFDTGSLSEIVQNYSGWLVPYGTNPWKLEKPDISALVNAAMEIIDDQPRFRAFAREQAELKFGLEQMVDEYLKVLLPE
jgi:glycosyltransferase involved in cell wall biosynthesis